MPMTPEQVGSVPQQQQMNGQNVSPDVMQKLNSHGLSKEQIDGFRKDPEIIDFVRKVTGRDFPMQQIDDVLMVQIAGMVHKLGVDGAVAEANRIMPPEMKAQIRGIAMKQGTPRIAPASGV